MLRAARVRAAGADETLKSLFTRALARELGFSAVKQRGELPVIASQAPGASRITPEQLEQILADDDAMGSA